LFLTHAKSQSRLQPFLAAGLLGWDFVELATQTPVVWVEAVEGAAESAKARIMLVKVYDLAPLSDRDDLQISCVRLLSPGYLNQSGGWAFDQIREVWRCSSLHEAAPVLGWAFVLQDGREYVYCGGATTPEEIRRTACTYGPRLTSAATDDVRHEDFPLQIGEPRVGDGHRD